MSETSLPHLARSVALATLMLWSEAHGASLPAPKDCQVFFEHDSYRITLEAQKVIAGLGERFAGVSRDLSVVGFADRTGRPAYNVRLSERRARAVARDLRKILPVAGSSLHITWRGEKFLPYPGRDGVPEPLNRCVAVF
jgi:outer membrane protein OmpA-like peptidoglycan-associated protein